MKPDKKSGQPLPPWKEYAESEPTWGGWRQGYSEEWLHSVWLPFWSNIKDEEKRDYLLNHPPPSEEWLIYLTHHWR